MCIFSRPVASVETTQIFARLSGKGTQFLAYQMKYVSAEANAMILPLPVKQPAHEQSIRFIDLENHPYFFSALDDVFPAYDPLFDIGCSASFDDSALEVYQVGNYIASFVPTISDFDRLDAQFRLPQQIWDRVPEYQSFGFAVFQLAAGSRKPHPMAFEFETATDEVFFPTLHIHDGQIHKLERFDHWLYVQHAGLDSEVSSYKNADVIDTETGWIRSKHLAGLVGGFERSDQLLKGDLLIHRQFLKGELPNRDTTFQIAGDPLQPTWNLRPWIPFMPWLLAVGGLGWFIRRRATLKSRRHTKGESSETEGAGSEQQS